jgi:ApbE superfamily uncharacterized protein (UPF0280 family)
MSNRLSDACRDNEPMIREHFEVGETAVTILADRQNLIGVAKQAIFEARDILTAKIASDPFFKTTYEPYMVCDDDDPLIIRMCADSSLANVGPMAGVAGAVAVNAVESMEAAGAEFAVVENGGDIAILTDRPISVGLNAGDEKFKGLALSINPTHGITGICSSSGKIGPSVSLGVSGICTVFSDDVILADECATAFGNLIKRGGRQEMQESAEKIGSIKGVKGCLACCNGLMAVFGDIPRFVNADFDPSSASRIQF